MSNKVKLTVITDNLKGKFFEFDTHDTLLFGRRDDCHICLPHDQFVSRIHFLMEVNPPQVCIRDLGSRNGTYVNDKKYGGRTKHETPEQAAKNQYPQIDLKDGDIIKVGNTKLRVEVQAEVRSVQTHRCQRCAKDITSDVHTGSISGLCHSCQQQANANPLASLQHTFRLVGMHENAQFQLADCEVIKKLGEGGMGEVYLVMHKKTGQLAALKVMLSKTTSDEIARRDFLREIETTRALQHPHIVNFLGSGAEQETFYFLIEYCQGGSVDQLMKHLGRPLTLQEAIPIMLGSLKGLAYAHQQGFIHRDLKPQNILLSGTTSNWKPKIADLGLAKSFIGGGLSGMTVTGGGFAGSLPYMPREQMINFKYVKPVSDVWSMGATFYHLLTGQFPRPFHAGQDPLDAVLSGTIISIRTHLPQLPKSFANVIDRAITIAPIDRYQTAGEMLNELEKIV